MNNQLLFKMLEGQNIDNKYYLKKLLGSGGFGGVYLADEVVRDRLIRTVALKLIITDNPDKQLDELIFSTTLEHPNLINCYTCGECNLNGADFLYLLMEKADYSLEDELKKGKLSEEEVKQLALDIAKGLDYLHSQKPVIVHRDLKPGNILRVGDKWKISDFGLVRSLKGTATQTTTMMGSMGYAPPEAYEGKISTGWDIWSLGIVIYEALIRKLPFDSDSPLQLMRQVADLEPDFNLISEYWREIIKGCLIKDNKQRFSSKNLGDKLQAKVELIKGETNQPPVQIPLSKTDLGQSKQQAPLSKRNKPPVQVPFSKGDLGGSKTSKINKTSIFYSLESLLSEGKWKEADQETTRLMLQLGDKSNKGYLDYDDCRNFPREELRTIDRLWLKYSEGKFGFSVQKRIYLEEGGKLYDYDYDYDSYYRMSDRIGWRKNNEWLSYLSYTFDKNTALQGHLPTTVWLSRFSVGVGCGVFLFSLL